MRPLDATRDAFHELLRQRTPVALPPLDTYDQIAAVFDHSVPAMAEAAGHPIPPRDAPDRDRLVKARRNWMRNPQRYERDRREGKPRPRTPRLRNLDQLREAARAKVRAEREAAPDRRSRSLAGVLDEIRRRGLTVAIFHGLILVSEQESYRKVLNIYIEPVTLDGFMVLDYADKGEWGNCADALADAWGISYMQLLCRWLNVDILKLRVGR